jgi:hypothetical protein
MITQCVDGGVTLWASPASLVGLHFTRSSFSYWRMLHVTTCRGPDYGRSMVQITRRSSQWGSPHVFHQPCHCRNRPAYNYTLDLIHNPVHRKSCQKSPDSFLKDEVLTLTVLFRSCANSLKVVVRTLVDGAGTVLRYGWIKAAPT